MLVRPAMAEHAIRRGQLPREAAVPGAAVSPGPPSHPTGGALTMANTDSKVGAAAQTGLWERERRGSSPTDAGVTRHLRESPYVLGLAAVSPPTGPHTPPIPISKTRPADLLASFQVRLSGRAALRLRSGRDLGHLDHGKLRRQVPTHLHGRHLQGLVHVDIAACRVARVPC